MPEVIAGLEIPETATSAAANVWTAIGLHTAGGIPGFKRTTMVECIVSSPWPS